MACSEAQMAANQANARRSTGPVSDRGKQISRSNSLKHGLTGEGVVLAAQHEAEVDRLEAAFAADFRPQSPVGKVMIRKMAIVAVRADRSTDQENAAIARNVRNAIGDFDESRYDKADALFDALQQDPRGNLRKLKRMPEGVDRLIAAWIDLRDDLTREGRGSPGPPRTSRPPCS